MKSMKYMKILDVFVVMPNHVHGIIIINNKTNGSADTTSGTLNREHHDPDV
jgi:REP element-mobilizing transposase RayT